MTTSTTNVVRRQLGRRLRRLRETAGKTAADVAQAGVASKAKLSRIENGWAVVKMADARTMCWLYGADPQTTETLCRMAAGTSAPDWWESSPATPDADGRLYPGLEALASRLSCYEPGMVPPLLQTSEYLRAVSAAGPRSHPLPAERQLAEHAHRVRAGFERVRPLEVRAVLDAAVLSRVVGGPEVMSGQVRKLVQQSRLPQMEIRVLPWSAGAHPAMRSGFTLLDFDSEEDPPVACVDTLVGTLYVAEEGALSFCREVFESLLGHAVPLEEHLAAPPAVPAIDLRGVNGQVTKPDALPRR